MSCNQDCRKPRGRQAHCGADGCHKTFSCVSNFDVHRRGGACIDVTSVGMTEKDRVWAMWGSSFDNKWWS